MSVTRLVFGLLGHLSLGALGKALGYLTLDGALALAVSGGLIFGGGGWTWGLLAMAVLIAHFGLTWRGLVSQATPHNRLRVVAIWGPPALVALVYDAREHSAAWAAFIGATAFAAADEMEPSGKSAPAFSLTAGTLTGLAMLVLHDLAAVRRSLPTGWIDLWLIPLGTAGALSGVAVRTWTQRWLHPDLARFLGGMSAAIFTAIIGQSGWQSLTPIL